MAKDPFAEALADVRKRHKISIGAVSEVVKPPVGLTTGNLGVDYCTGIGGLPLGRIIELYGPPSSGKTTTAVQCAALLQQQMIVDGSDDHILFLDFEHAFDATYAMTLGLDVEHPSFILVQPRWLEEGADIALKLVPTGKIRLSIWDSVARMTPQDLMEGAFDQRTNAMNRARLLGGLLQKLTAFCAEHDSAAIFLNHLVQAIEMNGRPGVVKEDTPGGRALKYYASLRIKYQQIGNVTGNVTDALTAGAGLQAVATKTKVTVTKNKVGPPFRTCEVRVALGRGFDNVWQALQVLLNHKKVMKEGAWYRFDKAKVPNLADDDMTMSPTGRPSLQGEAAVLRFAAEHPQWRDELIRIATDLVAAYGTGEPVTQLDDIDTDNLLDDSARC